MEIIASGPIRAASILWQPTHGGFVLTVVCKATYVLSPGESPLADEQEYINEDDNHWNDDPARSLYSPSDLVPFKVRADVMLVGHAFAPRGEQARSIIARLLVGDLDKGIEVFGDRMWGQDRKLRDTTRFVKMPLRYERAAGGPDTSNPVGIRADVRDMVGNTPVPNLQPVGLHIASPEDSFGPINFGPIAPGWRERRDRLGRYAASWSDTTWNTRPLPDDIDPGFFNAAPRDQQIPEIRDNERIVLENLHPTHARLVTNLSGARPYGFVARPGAPPQEIALKADTLWIDTDRSLCTLTWRAQIKMDSPSQPGRVLIAMARPGQRLTWADVQHIDNEHVAHIEDPHELTVDAFPDPDEEPGDTMMLPSNPLKNALPFIRSGGAPMAPSPRPAPPIIKPPMAAPPVITPPMAAPPVITPPMAAPPVITPAIAAPPMVSQPMAPPPMPAAAIPQPPPIAYSSQPSAPIAPPLVDSPWAASATMKSAESTNIGMPAPRQSAPSMPAPIPPSRPSSPGMAAQPPPPVSSSASSSLPKIGAGAAAGAVGVALTGAALGGQSGSGGVPGGAVAASNAAASATAWSTSNPAPLAAEPASTATTTRSGVKLVSREVIDLLWYDPAFVDRIREEPKWKELLASLKPKPKPAPFDDDPFEDAPKAKPPEKEKINEERRDVFGVVTRATATDLEGVNEAIADGVAEDGTFNRPLLVLSGDLTFPFDELETLKANVTAVTPLIANDKKLKETVDTVNELLKTPWLQSSSGVAEGLTTRVKDAFNQGNRMLPPSYLDTHTERMLLEQRHYQKRTVFGEPWIRSLLVPLNAMQSIPAYLPESVSKKLPMFQTMRVRLIAEAHLQQDQYETHPSCLRVIALGRVVMLASGSGAAGKSATKQ